MFDKLDNIMETMNITHEEVKDFEKSIFDKMEDLKDLIKQIIDTKEVGSKSKSNVTENPVIKQNNDTQNNATVTTEAPTTAEFKNTEAPTTAEVSNTEAPTTK